MTTLRLLPFMILIYLFSGCDKGCDMDCSCYPTLVTTGFGDQEFDSVVLKTFAPDSNFSSPAATHVFTKDGIAPKWAHINSDSTNDTLSVAWMIEYILSDNANRHSAHMDLEISIPSAGKTHRFSQITFSGPETNKVKCQHGDPIPGLQCSSRQYISSYVLDGNKVVFQPNNSYIYFTK